MHASRVIHTVSAHAEGEVGDVIVGGVAPPPGNTLWEQSRWIARDAGLRRLMLHEPRGGVFRHANLLVPPKDPRADAAFIIMEPADTPPMSGSNSICVATVLLETGILPITGPQTIVTLEAPGGLVRAVATCNGGKVERVAVENLPSFAVHLDASLEVPGLGRITVDTAFGGDSFVIVRATDAGVPLEPRHACEIVRAGIAITNAANAQLAFDHPKNPDWRHHSFCLFAGDIHDGPDGPEAQSVVAIQPGKLDRSPCGTGVSARLAVLHARGQMGVGDRLVARSIIGSRFDGEIVEELTLGGRPAIRPRISGRAWVTGTHQHMLDPDDPWPEGYRLSDTWPSLD